MKKILLTAVAVTFTLCGYAATPDWKEQAGKPCNANGEDGRVQVYEQKSYGRSEDKNDWGASAEASYESKRFKAGGKGEYSESSNKSRGEESTVYGTQCVTDRATYYNYKDGHINK